MYPKIRIIVMASYNNHHLLLEQLYQLKIYNIVNTDSAQNIEKQMLDALSEKGIQKKQVRRFDIQEQEKQIKKNKQIEKLKYTITNIKKKIKKENMHEKSNVYFLFLETVTRIIKLLSYILFFILTSIGITVLFNENLRNMMLQIIEGR